MRCFATGNIVFHDVSAIYFFVPMAACSELKMLFGRLEGIDLQTPRDAHHHDWDTVDRDGAHVLGGYFKFIFVRHPFDRLVSCWADMVRDRLHPMMAVQGFRAGMPFDEFARMVADIPDDVAHPCIRSQHWWADYVGMAPGFVGRFESLKQDVGQVCMTLWGADEVEIPSVPQPRHDVWRGYYDDDSLAEAVMERYQTDMQRYDYGFWEPDLKMLGIDCTI